MGYLDGSGRDCEFEVLQVKNRQVARRPPSENENEKM